MGFFGGKNKKKKVVEIATDDLRRAEKEFGDVLPIKYRCPKGCKEAITNIANAPECPVCGSTMKRV